MSPASSYYRCSARDLDSAQTLTLSSTEKMDQLDELTMRPVELTKEELQSLAWIYAVATRIAIPVAHIEKLLTLGYIEEGLAGPRLTRPGWWPPRSTRSEPTPPAVEPRWPLTAASRATCGVAPWTKLHDRAAGVGVPLPRQAFRSPTPTRRGRRRPGRYLSRPSHLRRPSSRYLFSCT
jgi:hypothetical protein